MTLLEAKQQADRTLASLFYERMKEIKAESGNAQDMYKRAIDETSALLLHMRDRLDVLFGHDTEALALFLAEAGVKPEPTAHQPTAVVDLNS